MTSRRQFLEASGALAAAAAIAGCDTSTHVRSLLNNDVELPFASPTDGAVDGVAHTIARLSYGARPGEHARVRALGATKSEPVSFYIEEQLSPRHYDQGVERAVRLLEALAEPLEELYEFQPSLLRDQIGAAAVLRAVYGERQLHEVMVGFWTDHFNIDISKGDCRWLTPACDRDVIRPHTLGRFPELLRSVVLSPAML